ncbi:hypothetical protein NDU88_002525 [Pleurodeles waltl]|uniref:Uncharacterized protein n=1 Tax=Pleurodeles waltl TaxID=8319 RepID=A0AAV7LG16_PLEWA|nr:hypothetical protein NDU88_002525 [Pleurodeles waltl]
MFSPPEREDAKQGFVLPQITGRPVPLLPGRTSRPQGPPPLRRQDWGVRRPPHPAPEVKLSPGEVPRPRRRSIYEVPPVVVTGGSRLPPPSSSTSRSPPDLRSSAGGPRHPAWAPTVGALRLGPRAPSGGAARWYLAVGSGQSGDPAAQRSRQRERVAAHPRGSRVPARSSEPGQGLPLSGALPRRLR